MLKVDNAPFAIGFAPRTHRTRIEIVGYGGQIKFGRVDEDVAAYWIDKDPAELGDHIYTQHLNVQQKLDGTPINPRRSRKNWKCICNIALDGGVEMTGRVDIKAFAEDGSQLLNHVQMPDETSWPINQVDDTTFYQFDPRYNHMMGRTFDVFNSTFVVESKSSFDSDLLDLNLLQTGWGTFIKSISYDAQVIEAEDQNWIPVEAPKVIVLKKGEQ